MKKFVRMIKSEQIIQKVLGSVLGLTIGAAAHASTEDVTYTYDEARAGYHNTGQLTTISNGAAIIHYDYNSHGQLVRERYIIDGQTYTRTYSYDDGNRLRARSFSDGETWPPSSGQYQYDRAGRLLAIPGAINQIRYSPDAEIARIDHANGTHTLNSYDTQRKWLLGTKLSKGSQVLFEEQYTRDTVGRISKIRSNRTNGNWDYTYDSINQLTAATNVGNSALTRSFTYSPSGNLLSKSDVGTYSYPAPTAARPHAPTKAGSWTFSYDGNGNMVSGKGRTITYDGKDRPISVTMGGVTTQYVYGPDDKRLKKISGGQTTLYLGDDEEILPDGTVIKHLDGSVRRVGTTTNWIHRDHMSSVRMLTNNTGSIAAVSRYQPYGKRTDVQQAADTPRESKGWIGERDDPETGLTYLNARYYDADLARFIQSDWLGPTDPYVGTNRYSYALNNPVTFKDPSGHRIDDFNEIGSKGVTSGASTRDEYNRFQESRHTRARTEREYREYDYSDYNRDNGGSYGREKFGEHVEDWRDYGPSYRFERSSPSGAVQTADGVFTLLSGGGLAVVVGKKAVSIAGSQLVGKATVNGLSGLTKSQARTLLKTATEAYKGSTRVGHALSKHAGRNPQIWGKVTGSSKTWNSQAVKHVREILRGPGTFSKTTTNKGITFIEKRLSDGRGIRLNQDYTFKGFID